MLSLAIHVSAAIRAIKNASIPREAPYTRAFLPAMFESRSEHDFHDFLVRIQFPREEAQKGRPPCFEVQASLLVESSPVFASMVDGPWSESHDRTLLVVVFSSSDFERFLRCLALHRAVASDVSFTPSPELIRAVLPIANYYQVEALRDLFVASVQHTLASTREDRYQAAAELAFAVESALPASDQIHWDLPVLTCINSCLFEVHGSQLTLPPGSDTARNELSIASCKPDLLRQLTRPTLQRCIETLCLRVEQSLTIAGSNPKNYKLAQDKLAILASTRRPAHGPASLEDQATRQPPGTRS